ncbi:MAB_1171c family putative transporter [Streptomyces sp. NPDC101150]|uniref:MAB_1171c family putative transporter n=1 Tax=Streptomyces sp. NPDC101150 TaxID=3366114 RepID=UPI00380C44A6
MNSVLYPICAALAGLALFYKLRVLSSDRSITQVALVSNFFFLFITYTVSTPAVWAAISHAIGIVNFSGILTQSCVILLTACQQIVLLHLSHEAAVAWRKATPRLIGLALVLITMVTLFTAASSHGENPEDFAINRAQYYPAYLAIYLLAYAANQVDVGILGWRYAKIAPHPWMRRGLYFIAATLPFALMYTACRTADIIAAQFNISGHAWEPVAQVAITLATISKTLGWILPDWGRHLSTLWQWINDYRTFRALAPLHREVTSQIPEPVLHLEPNTELRTRLYRRIVEIRDAQWALRSWTPAAVADAAKQHARAAGLTETDLAAAVEAAQLKAALHARATQRQPSVCTPTPRVAEPQDLAAELAFQRKLARAFTTSPIVSAAAAEFTAGPATQEQL